jgi:hypothetical protein
MSGNTELDIAKLDQQVMQLAMPQGRIDLRVRQLLEGVIEVDLPRGAVWILQPGIYDIDAAPGPARRIAVPRAAPGLSAAPMSRSTPATWR